MEQTNTAQGIMQTIQSTPPQKVAELEFVKQKFIQNYNATHKEKVGELMYHRQLIYFKQILSNSGDLQNCDPFSLYAAFVTVAVRGYSLDPEDNEVYLYPMGNKAYLNRQAGAYVRRLMETNQIKFADQPQLVFHGDEFEVERGRVIKHVEKFQSETIIAAYVRFVLDDQGSDRYFVYRKFDWENWKKKSPSKNSASSLWSSSNGQPDPGFLRTKIIKHACKEKCWAIGVLPVNVEAYEDVEVDVDEPDVQPVQPQVNVQPTRPQPAPSQPVSPRTNDFAEPAMNGSAANYDHDTF